MGGIGHHDGEDKTGVDYQEEGVGERVGVQGADVAVAAQGGDVIDSPCDEIMFL